MVPTRIHSAEMNEQAKQIQTYEIENHKIRQEEEQKQAEAKAAEELRVKKLDQLSKILTAKAQKLIGTKQGQCVIAVRNFLGVGRDQISGYVNVRINSQHPKVGNIIVIVGRMRHGAVVLFTTATKVVYYDSNGQLTGRAAIREIKINDKRIKGYRDTGIFDL